MSNGSIIWQLRLGGDLIATIQCTGHDFPWTHGQLVESPSFERFRVYFSDEDDWPDTQELDDLCSEIHAKGHFVLLNTATRESFVNLRLNHDGDQVWFRYS